MKSNKCIIVLVVAMMTIAAVSSAQGWLTRAAVQIASPGYKKAVLPPELHRAPSDVGTLSNLDLAVVGPDGKFRAYDLFMRTAGRSEAMEIAAEKVTLLDDRRILWEGTVSPDLLYSSIRVVLNGGNFTGKADFEALAGESWLVLATGTALMPQNGETAAEVRFPEAKFARVRCYFTGFDEYFKQTPIFVQSVSMTGRKPGSDFEYRVLTPEFEQSEIEQGIETRVFLPGSGLRIESIEVQTSAQFKGGWQIGREEIKLGRREFVQIGGGSNQAIAGEEKTLSISYPHVWGNRALLLRMQSDSYFGRIEKVRVKVMLPSIQFVADQPGQYALETGHKRENRVLGEPVEDKSAVSEVIVFDKSEENISLQAESILKTFTPKGAPFSADGYKWQAGFKVPAAGFFQLVTNEKISLDQTPAALRIVKDGFQIPYFLGGRELRELEIKADAEYDQANNRTLFIIRLPEKLKKPTAVKFRARGIFTRKLKFEKHEFGQISWQQWREANWVNKTDSESEFQISLADFPEDQKEIRLIVEHGSNQKLEIASFKGLYPAFDLFFVAGEAGDYRLVGGNAAAVAPLYDLAMIERKLSELVPEKIRLESIEFIASGSAAASAEPVIEQGAPFSDGGYSWVATFSAPAAGFYQLALNLKAALDSNPDGIRLVRNGQQVPYFPGQTSAAAIDLKFTSEYSRENNTTVINIELPAASKQWNNIEFTAGGVFSRTLTLEIRKPGKLGWKTFATSTWKNSNDSAGTHRITLNGLPEGETELRLSIPHGDNSPMQITSVKGLYSSRTLLFLANEPGEYHVYGGNPSAKAPRYDLAMISDSLLTREPHKIQLGEPASHSGASQVKKQVEEAFSDRGWGIYAILGLVTAILLVLIVRLFPEEKKAEAATDVKPENKE